MVFCDFFGIAEVFSVVAEVFFGGCGGSRGAGELLGVAEVFWAGDDGFLRGGGGGFLYDYSGFRPVRERNCYPGVLTCADPEAGGSGGVEAGTPAAVAGMPGAARVSVRSRRGSRGGFRQPRSWREALQDSQSRMRVTDPPCQTPSVAPPMARTLSGGGVLDRA